MPWYDCVDIDVRDDHGALIYTGPTYLRCTYADCLELITVGEIQLGNRCSCRRRKYRNAIKLSKEERCMLRNGGYKLTDWEEAIIFDEGLEG